MPHDLSNSTLFSVGLVSTWFRVIVTKSTNHCILSCLFYKPLFVSHPTMSTTPPPQAESLAAPASLSQNGAPSPPGPSAFLQPHEFVHPRRSIQNMVTPEMRKTVAHSNKNCLHSTDSRSHNLQDKFLPLVLDGMTRACASLRLTMAAEDRQWLVDHCGRYQFYLPTNGPNWKSLLQSKRFKQHWGTPALPAKVAEHVVNKLHMKPGTSPRADIRCLSPVCQEGLERCL